MLDTSKPGMKIKEKCSITSWQFKLDAIKMLDDHLMSGLAAMAFLKRS